MKTYALMDDNTVREIIAPFAGDDGIEVTIDKRFAPDLVKRMIDVTGIVPQPEPNWVFDGAQFSPAPVYQPTPEEIKATNVALRDHFLGVAALAIAPLQDAVDLDDATAADIALLKTWKQYRVDVNRIDLALVGPDWPVAPV